MTGLLHPAAAADRHPATHRAQVRTLPRHGKLAAVTEFGCCTYREAAEQGGSGGQAWCPKKNQRLGRTSTLATPAGRLTDHAGASSCDRSDRRGAQTWTPAGPGIAAVRLVGAERTT